MKMRPSAHNIERRYWIAAELYDEYSAFDSDSAMAYAERARELAARMNRRELVDVTKRLPRAL